MFDKLTNRLSQVLQKISNSRYLTEDNIKNTLREVRIALLEADVALPVVQEFIKSVKNVAIGQIVESKRLTPGQEFIKIVHKELTKALGEKNNTLNLGFELEVSSPAVILIVGLQGAGKTTTVAKLGKWLTEKHKKKVLVVSADIYRPAAIKQLEMLIQTESNIVFFPSIVNEKPINIVNKALQYAKSKIYEILIIDTAGSININKVMMEEIKLIYKSTKPIETLFIIDAMTGQDAAITVNSFNKQLLLTGIILTKMDGDARGGSALSIRKITGTPIKFLGIGETIDKLEPFYPDRIASRILGMGDAISLIEEIEKQVNHDHIKKITSKIKKGEIFDLNDFLEYLRKIRKMGGISNILNKIPNMSHISNLDIDSEIKLDDKFFVKIEAIISSMTSKERRIPEIIKGSRKRRIAIGSGTEIQDVNRLLKQFNHIQRIIKNMKKFSMSNFLNKIIR